MRESIPIVLSYLLGSIPFGFIIAFVVKGIDIRNFGSGNIGATNVFRVVGKVWGIAVFLLDFVKGFLPPFLVARFFTAGHPQGYLILTCAVLAIVGHNWPVFLRFKGGKGVATSVGVIFGLGFVFSHLWLILGLSLLVFVVTFLIFRYVSLASMVSAAAFVVFSFVFKVSGEIKFFSFLLLAFIILRHKKNIKNILAKKEYKF